MPIRSQIKKKKKKAEITKNTQFIDENFFIHSFESSLQILEHS